MAVAATKRDDRRQRLQRRIAARQRNKHRAVSSEFIHPRHDLGRRHQYPLVVILGQYRVERVAPSAAIVATGRAHEDGRLPDERPFTLNGRPKDFTDADTFDHDRNSAQVSDVSATRIATTSGQRDLHQS